MRKYQLISLMLVGFKLFNITCGYAQYSLPFFQNEYKEKYETQVRSFTQLEQVNTRLSLKVRMLSDSIRQLNLVNNQLRTSFSQLEINRQKVEGLFLAYRRENKRMHSQLAMLKDDTLRLNRELVNLSLELKEVEEIGIQQSASFERQMSILQDSLTVNNNLYRKTSEDLSRINTLVSYIKLGDIEFNIPSDQFISVLHSAIIAGNTPIILRTSFQREAVVLFDTKVRKSRLIGHKMVPYHLEAYISYLPHPLEAVRTIASIKTRAYKYVKGSRAESSDYGDTEMVKAKFYKELEKLDNSYGNNKESSSGSQLGTSVQNKF